MKHDPSRHTYGSVSFERRRPAQTARAHATVDRILRATEALLAEGTFSRITTNHIAARAKVNIGSVYQYFSTREAIALELLEQVSNKTSAIMRDSVLRHVEQDIETAMPKMIRRLVRVYREHASVLLRLVDELPQLRELSPLHGIHDTVVSIGRLYIEQQRPDLEPSRRETAYQFLSGSVLASIRGYLLSSPPAISENSFVTELSRSIVAYIRAL